MNKRSILLGGATMLLASVAFSQENLAKTEITAFGEGPYTGSAQEACERMGYGDDRLLACVTSLSDCWESDEEIFIQDETDILTLGTNKDGTHVTVVGEVALVYPDDHDLAGQPLPEDHPDRRAKVCKMFDDESDMYILVVCKNPTRVDREKTEEETESSSSSSSESTEKEIIVVQVATPVNTCVTCTTNQTVTPVWTPPTKQRTTIEFYGSRSCDLESGFGEIRTTTGQDFIARSRK